MTSPHFDFPIVDISPLLSGDSNAEICIQQIKNACSTTGFFGIKSTGISTAAIEQVYRHSADFHGLSDAIKQPLISKQSAAGRGWIPLYQEPAYEAGKIAHVEAFDLALHLLPGDRDYIPSPLLGPNVYPNLSGFQADLDAFYARLYNIGQLLLSAFAKMLDLEADRFQRMSTRQAGSKMRLLHYPGMGDRPHISDATGIGAHTDFEVFTILHQNAPGLELKTRAGDWVQVPVLPDVFTIILDDALEFWTNGLLKATQHRVPLTAWERYSIILFYAANVNQTLAPLPEFVTPDRPVQYPTITQAEHILQQVNAGLENLARLT